MNTPWTKNVDKGCPHGDYPRPQMVREGWVSLNGPWDYSITKTTKQPTQYDGTITVPFSPETQLSGVSLKVGPNDYLWYHRAFRLPESFEGNKVILHFGAVDQEADVWVNGFHVASHIGGYLPFEAEISESLLGGLEVEITVRVRDASDYKNFHTRGKQKLKRGGIWYTAQSGIWQSVWMEAVPASGYIKSLKIDPIYDNSCVFINADCEGEDIKPVAIFEENTYELPARIPVPDFIPWSPETPKLYHFDVVFGDDTVSSYFAMRKYSVEEDENGVPRFFLNNRPYFLNGLLDQGYWPDGLYTAPCDEAYVYDIAMAKTMGFNLLRKHMKIEPLRWYYHCDRIGMLVWQDMPSGGSRDFASLRNTAPVIFGSNSGDGNYSASGRGSAESREEFIKEIGSMINCLYNVPCIAAWVPFNEGWGQFDAAKICDYIMSMDSSRTVDHASGWHDRHAGDFKSLHVYFKKYRFKPDQYGRAVVLSEFGGYAQAIQGHMYSNKEFGYKRTDSAAELEFELKELYEEQIRPAVKEGLAGCIYTQLSDVEDEINGLVTYDRRKMKLAPEVVKRIIEI